MLLGVQQYIIYFNFFVELYSYKIESDFRIKLKHYTPVTILSRMWGSSPFRILRGNSYLTIRKSSVASVKLIPGVGHISINSIDLTNYVQNNPKLLSVIQSPLQALGLDKTFDVVVKVSGGGLNGQSEAIRLGVARSLFVLLDAEDQRKLRSFGFLTRNSLCKERRKYGLKKARKAPQFSKR